MSLIPRSALHFRQPWFVFLAILCYDKGSAQPLSTPGPSPLLSIDAWTIVTCPRGERVSLVALDTTSTLFHPEGRKQKKTLYDRRDRVLLPPAPETGPSPLLGKTCPTSFFPRQEGGPGCGSSVYRLGLFSICLGLPAKLYTLLSSHRGAARSPIGTEFSVGHHITSK
ncbi:hypothetical protein BC827DRAFT_428125 [Russula dissimulans]|nr:hypothetical protein BC827DRAFT_428125 [Russula dissimulans]